MSSFLIEIPNYQQIVETFALELQECVAGKQTSIPFIRNPLPRQALVAQGDLFQVFVIGGTNGETALVQSLGGKSFSLLTHEKFVLPKFERAEDFFSFLEEHLDPRVEVLALNFAFTLIPVAGEMGELDGIMESGDTKGHAFVGLQKERVGKSIQQYFQKKRRRVLVTVANDTVCLLLSSLQNNIEKSSLVGGIVGTGYNLAMFLEDHTAVNLQASDFSDFHQTDSGRFVDGESTNKGAQLYNKEVAAGELYKHFNIYIDLLKLSVAKINSTEELGKVAFEGYGKPAQVARELFERSAALVAAQLAGLYRFKDARRLSCVMEGSLFWKGVGYKEMVELMLQRLGVPEKGIVFQQVVESGILGAAHLVLA